jgi:predicted ArsR family transcriptional regulator
MIAPVLPGLYPQAAGWKDRASETSEAAAAVIDAGAIRATVYAWLVKRGPHTADEIADALDLSILTVRPRCSELRATNHIFDTGVRRPNASGRMAIVWRS